jgi:hypothetical protein
MLSRKFATPPSRQKVDCVLGGPLLSGRGSVEDVCRLGLAKECSGIDVEGLNNGDSVSCCSSSVDAIAVLGLGASLDGALSLRPEGEVGESAAGVLEARAEARTLSLDHRLVSGRSL